MDSNIARPVGRPRTRPIHPQGYDSQESVAARRAYMQAYKVENAEHLKAYYKQWRLDHKCSKPIGNTTLERRKLNGLLEKRQG